MRWATIEHHPMYEVSEAGDIRNRRTKRVLAQSENGHGLLKVNLSEEGESETHPVARLVADCFCEPPEEGDVIFYIDNNKSNVHYTNIVWRPRWFAQEWAYQLRRTKPMRNRPIERFPRDGSETHIYANSLECALETSAIEKYIVLACGRDTIYNGAMYEWV